MEIENIMKLENIIEIENMIEIDNMIAIENIITDDNFDKKNPILFENFFNFSNKIKIFDKKLENKLSKLEKRLNYSEKKNIENKIIFFKFMQKNVYLQNINFFDDLSYEMNNNKYLNPNILKKVESFSNEIEKIENFLNLNNLEKKEFDNEKINNLKKKIKEFENNNIKYYALFIFFITFSTKNIILNFYFDIKFSKEKIYEYLMY